MEAADETQKEAWCVYVLRCRNDALYIGLTNNVHKRLGEHEKGTGSKYVRSQRPFRLVKTIPCNNASEARSLEYRLKRLSRSRKIEMLGLNSEQTKN
ncbi:MAG: GIY-YIG nuclease family protein [Nitrospirae bacterium]|nr:GIY-YIG nuclease family protein [Nitrospirota bacterium]